MPDDAWYAAAVRYAYAEGLMNGVDSDVFAPAMELNRAMVVTVLHRMAGCPQEERSTPFADVPADSFYAEAANRAQFTVILYRFAMPGNDSLVLYLRVLEGVATDLVTGKTFPDIAVTNGYLGGGRVTLPRSYTNWTYEMIVDYNERSDQGIIRGMSFVSNSGQTEQTIISLRPTVRIPMPKNTGMFVAQGYMTSYGMTHPENCCRSSVFSDAGNTTTFPTGPHFAGFLCSRTASLYRATEKPQTAPGWRSTTAARPGCAKSETRGSMILPAAFSLW